MQGLGQGGARLPAFSAAPVFVHDQAGLDVGLGVDLKNLHSLVHRHGVERRNEKGAGETWPFSSATGQPSRELSQRHHLAPLRTDTPAFCS